jgi:hypothetical protein
VVAQRGRISDLETTLAMVGDERAQWNVDLDQLVAERDAALSLVEERDARLEQYRRDLNAFRGMRVAVEQVRALADLWARYVVELVPADTTTEAPDGD